MIVHGQFNIHKPYIHLHKNQKNLLDVYIKLR